MKESVPFASGHSNSLSSDDLSHGSHLHMNLIYAEMSLVAISVLFPQQTGAPSCAEDCYIAVLLH